MGNVRRRSILVFGTSRRPIGTAKTQSASSTSRWQSTARRYSTEVDVELERVQDDGPLTPAASDRGGNRRAFVRIRPHALVIGLVWRRPRHQHSPISVISAARRFLRGRKALW